jgi:Phage integrase, N-terminal SAM-like domain
MKPCTPGLRAIRLLDQVRERIRYLRYSLSTEKNYLHWIKFFIRWQARDGSTEGAILLRRLQRIGNADHIWFSTHLKNQ